jgi:hypothetical protein
VDVQIYIFLTSALVGGEWSASRPCRFTPSTHWIGGWVGSRANLDDMDEKILALLGLELQSIGGRYTDCTTPGAIPKACTQLLGPVSDSLYQFDVQSFSAMYHIHKTTICYALCSKMLTTCQLTPWS